MGSESVGSCTPPVESHRPGGFQEDVHQRGARGSGGACYFCHQHGHWFKDCPSRNVNRKPDQSSQGAGMVGPGFPDIHCPCGAGSCVVLTSKTDKNPGRKFYRCPVRPFDEKCNFFAWCDEAHFQKRGHGVAKPQPLYPSCACGAGRCRLLTMDNGEDKGRKYFACTIKRGQGACNFFQWYDTLGKDREINDDRSKESIPLSSHVSYEESRDTSKMDGGEKKDGSRLEGTFSVCSEEKVMPSSASKAYQVEEDGCSDQLVRKQITLPAEAVKNVPPLSSTGQVKDEERSDQLAPNEATSGHAGKSPSAALKSRKCFSCGIRHWIMQCIGYPTYFCCRCGKTGHQKKVCAYVQKRDHGVAEPQSLYPSCACSAGRCILLTMDDGEDKGRKYFSCPVKKFDEKCNFFVWCDEAHVQKRDHGVAKPQPLYPSCACGAGRCILLTMDNGEDKGRKYFACPVKRGQGACNFFQWYDILREDWEINYDRSKESIPLSSHVSCEESRDTSKMDGGEKKDGSRLEGPLSVCSDEKVMPSSTSKAHQVEEDGCYDQLVRKQVTSPAESVKNVPPLSSTEQVKDEEQSDQLAPNEALSGHAAYVQKRDHGVAEPQPLYPSCACSAGRCILLTMDDGEEKGRKYFSCPVKKGQGACNFFQWYDTLGNDTEINNDRSKECIPLSSHVSSKESRDTSKHDGGEKNDGSRLEGLLSVCSDENVLPSSTSKVHQVDEDGCYDELVRKQVTLPAGSVKNVPPLSSTEQVKDEERPDVGKPVTLHVGSVKNLPPLSSTEQVKDEERSVQLTSIDVPSVHAGKSPSAALKSRKCFSCGIRHWMVKCIGYPASICCKCCKTGHQKKVCGA